MRTVKASTRIDDYMLGRGIDMERMEQKIKNDLAMKIAQAIVEDGFKGITITREADPFCIGQTRFDIEVAIPTKQEVEEYKALKEFQKQMRQFVKPATGGIYRG